MPRCCAVDLAISWCPVPRSLRKIQFVTSVESLATLIKESGQGSSSSGKLKIRLQKFIKHNRPVSRARYYYEFLVHRSRVSSSDLEVWYVSIPSEARRR